MDATAFAFQHLGAHAVPFLLVLSRIAGVFIAAPLLTSLMVPTRYKALLAMMLAAAVYPVVRTKLMAPVTADVFALAPLVLGEALIGYAVGMIASIPLLAMEMAGVIGGQSMGFGLARVYNPEADVDTDLLGQLLFYIALGVFIGVGGLDLLIRTVLETFDNVPAGGLGAGEAPLDLLLGVLSSGFELAMRVAAPVVGIVMLLALVLGVMTKTMPQMNVMTVGFTAKVIGGLALLALSVYAIRTAAGDEVLDVLGQLRRWAVNL